MRKCNTVASNRITTNKYPLSQMDPRDALPPAYRVVLYPKHRRGQCTLSEINWPGLSIERKPTQVYCKLNATDDSG